MLATQITAGMKFTDDMGHTHTAVRVEQGVAEGRGVYIFVEGQDYPEFYLNEVLMFVEAPAAPKRPAAPVLGEYMTAKVIEAESRVRYLKRNKTADDGQWRYLRTQDEAGRVAVRREYKTEAGFLAAFIREARAGHDILIAE